MAEYGKKQIFGRKQPFQLKQDDDSRSNVMTLPSTPAGKTDTKRSETDTKSTEKKYQDIEQFRPEPQYYENGQVAERYRSTKGRDLLYGLTQGARMGMGQDPFFQLGAVIGGLIGGAINKNVGGYGQYKVDVAETQEYNERVAFRTNASTRAQLQQVQMQATQDRIKLNQEQLDLSEAKFEYQKTQASKIQDLKWWNTEFNAWRQQPDSVQKEAQRLYLEDRGKVLFDNPNFQLVGGDAKEPVKNYGGFWGTVDGNNKLSKVFTEEGEVVSDWSDPDVILKIYNARYKQAKDQKMSTEEAIQKATEQVAKLGGKYKTTAQKTAAVLGFARLYASGESDTNLPDINDYLPKPGEPAKEKPVENESPMMTGYSPSEDLFNQYKLTADEFMRGKITKKNVIPKLENIANQINSLKNAGNVDEKQYDLWVEAHKQAMASLGIKNQAKPDNSAATPNLTAEEPININPKIIKKKDGTQWIDGADGMQRVRFKNGKWQALHPTTKIWWDITLK